MIRDRARQHPQIAFPFSPGKLLPSYGDSTDLTIYRCVQESLTNAIRHAKASRIRVDLAEVPNSDAGLQRAPPSRLELVVEDDGCGIDPHAPAGFGLQGMQERVRALGGECSLVSRNGTSVRVVIPVPDRDGRPG
jgi:two-component system sensor histidine kinase UhpB